MNAVRRFPHFQPSLTSTDPREQKALLRLLEAATTAERFDSDKWQFALELHDLEHDGITASVLRGLVLQGLAAHACEKTRPRAVQRTFQFTAHLHFTGQSCFILTDAGMAQTRSLGGLNGTTLATDNGTGPSSINDAPPIPSFVRCADGHRELRVLGSVVKSFRIYAMNQERFLTAFEDAGWPRWIKNPFLGAAELNPKRRQHNTVDRLNREQVHPLLRFHGDGTGLGASWELDHGAVDKLTTCRR